MNGETKALVLVVPLDTVPTLDPVVIGYPDVSSFPPTQLLVLRESYSRDWTGPLNSKHVLVNGMTNGWLVEPTGPVSSPKYAPAELVSASLWLSAASFVLMLVLAVALRFLNHMRSVLPGREHH
jgi:hypothetical protein